MLDAPSTPNEPILLATQGLKESDAAVHAAADLAVAIGRPVVVVAVLEPPPLVTGDYGFVVPVQDVWEDRRDTLAVRVRQQIQTVLGRDPEWPIEIRTGNPSTTIAEAAASSDAVLIVMGLGQHHLIDRVLGDETALHTLREASTPVLAVPHTYSAPLTRAVAGIDFSDASVVAAKDALTLIPSLTRLALVHVAPRWDLQPTAYVDWRAEYERGVSPALERVLRQLDAPPSITLSNVIREGKPVKELLKAAEEYEAELVVVASKGLGILDRLLVGSTASGIIRGAQTAVFALPITALARPTPRPVGAGSDMFTVGVGGT